MHAKIHQMYGSFWRLFLRTVKHTGMLNFTLHITEMYTTNFMIKCFTFIENNPDPDEVECFDNMLCYTECCVRDALLHNVMYYSLYYTDAVNGVEPADTTLYRAVSEGSSPLYRVSGTHLCRSCRTCHEVNKNCVCISLRNEWMLHVLSKYYG